jgi:hypothetical protein
VAKKDVGNDMIETIFMNIGTWTLALASLPQMKSIWMNRRNLKGYSTIGSLLLALGLSAIGVAFVYVGDYISMIAGLIQIVMWLMAAFYSWRSSR